MVTSDSPHHDLTPLFDIHPDIQAILSSFSCNQQVHMLRYSDFSRNIAVCNCDFVVMHNTANCSTSTSLEIKPQSTSNYVPNHEVDSYFGDIAWCSRNCNHLSRLHAITQPKPGPKVSGSKQKVHGHESPAAPCDQQGMPLMPANSKYLTAHLHLQHDAGIGVQHTADTLTAASFRNCQS